MKKIFTIITFLMTLIVLGQSSTSNLTGNWSFKDSSTIFTIKLSNNNNNIEAELYSVMYSGTRMDGFPGEKNFKGILNRGVIFGSFQSFYGGGTGKATITILPDGKLKWEITQKPKGEYYIPDKAVLNKSL